MRIFVIPLLAVGVMIGTVNDEPSERQMRIAFESSLAADVRGAVALAAETGGAEAVERMRRNATDQFAIQTFEKRDCARELGRPGYVCGFNVEIGLANGELRRTLTGHFDASPDGLVFTSAI